MTKDGIKKDDTAGRRELITEEREEIVLFPEGRDRDSFRVQG